MKEGSSSADKYRAGLANRLRSLRHKGKREEAKVARAQERQRPIYALAEAISKRPEPADPGRWKRDEIPSSEANRYVEVISNEPSLFEIFPYLSHLNGAGLGVGFDQMLDIVVNSGLERAYIVDISPATSLATKALLETGRLFHVATERYPSPEELIEHFGEERVSLTLEALTSSFDSEELKRIRQVFSEKYKRRKEGTPGVIEHYLRFKSRQTEYASWVSTPEHIAHIIDMYETGRIVPVQANVAGTQSLPQIAAELRRDNMPLSMVYLSNATDYLRSYGAYDEREQLYANLMQMPITEDTCIVKSDGLGVMNLKPPAAVANDPFLGRTYGTGWSYTLQTFADIMKENAGAYRDQEVLTTSDRIARVLRSPERSAELGLFIPKPGIVIAGLKKPEDSV